jgi:hypothetical protein
MIIGVSGKKRHGKGTVAGILVAEYGFVQHDFADALRGDMAVLNPVVGIFHSEDDWGEHYAQLVRYQDAVNKHGYEQAKEIFPEIVRLLQVYGTEVGRNRVSEWFWAERWVHTLDELDRKTNIVVSDVRFESEVRIVQHMGLDFDSSYFLGVHRPGYVHDANADQHSSEQLPELPDERSTIIEASSVESLTEQVHIVMARLGFERHTNSEGQ